ncbi:Multidrug resistance protein 1 [Nymphon striatum]|nr:Multidrug resistance protein 1 [Nymphon striatum]
MGRNDIPYESANIDESLALKNRFEIPKFFYRNLDSSNQNFRYSTSLDKMLIIMAIILSLASGLSNPIISVISGDLTDLMVNYDFSKTFGQLNKNMTKNFTQFTYISDEEFRSKISYFSIILAIVGVVEFIIILLMVWMINYAAEKQKFRIQNLFMKSILRQEISWFDTNQTNDFSSQIGENLLKLQQGIGEKVTMSLYFLSTFLISVIVAFIYGWKLTLVILSIMPLLIFSSGVIASIQAKFANKELKAYSNAAAIAEEVLGAIKLVVAFGGESKELERYDKNLVSAKQSGLRRGFATALSLASVNLCIFIAYSLGFWYGIKLIIDSRINETYTYTSGTIIKVFINVLNGAMFLGQAAPYLEVFSVAKAAAVDIFEVIEREPEIDSSSSSGIFLDEMDGKISFKNVHFSYPSRPDVKILNGLNLEIKKGEKVALVGPSGCGKSTVVQLIQRLYDCNSGSVRISDENVKDLNVGWLRDNISLVSQEPSLFATNVSENISFGLDMSEDKIISAAKAANAHNFITKLPNKYDTLVGARGSQMSGGQKQRIAIARALIRDPKILLLDEATSALDTESESIVQAALDDACKGRTTIMIAHRLSTIRNADRIIVIGDGKVQEEGSHQELINQKRLYYQLVSLQVIYLVLEESAGIHSIIDEKMDGIALFVFLPPGLLQVSVMLKRNFTQDTKPNWSYGVIRVTVVNAIDSSADFKNEVESHEAHLLKRSVSRHSSGSSLQNNSFASEEDFGSVMMKGTKEIPNVLWRTIVLNAPEKHFIIIGVAMSVLIGSIFTLYAFYFGEVLGIFSMTNNEKALQKSVTIAITFLGIGVGSFILTFMQMMMFSLSGEHLTLRMRSLAFAAMLKQDIGWYDDKKNSAGSLCTILSSDAASVQGATGARLGTVIQGISSIGAALGMSFYYSWELTLVVGITIPILMVSVYYEGKFLQSQSIMEKDSLDEANKIAVEALDNIRTVVSFHQERKFYEKFIHCFKSSFRIVLRNTFFRASVFAFSQITIYFAYAAAFVFGGYIMQTRGLKYENFFKVLESILISTYISAQAFAFTPDYHKAKVSAARILRLLDQKPEIDVTSGDGYQLKTFDGEVTFKDINFSYPNRPDATVLRGVDFKVKPGMTLALVGSSGCGKSTCIQLIERFYEPDLGEILFGSTDYLKLNLKWLRSQIGLVQQEPILFGYSIKENIAYGNLEREIPEEEIIQAAQDANIHEFITGLPNGYNTNVGTRGAQLSGGQKQRVAIARALIRKPKLLVLDEATSALDSESEKIVEEALEKARKGRSCILIAHRLSTVQNADCIISLKNGHVVEMGTHKELLKQKGFYYLLHQRQALSVID